MSTHKHNSIRACIEAAFKNDNPDALHALVHQADLPSFVKAASALARCGRGISHKEGASSLLGMCAHNAVYNEEWSDYCEGLFVLIANGDFPGMPGWAYRMDLPILNCLPMRETMARHHHGIENTDDFLMMYALTFPETAHQSISALRFLENAPSCPHEALFSDPSAPHLCTRASL